MAKERARAATTKIREGETSIDRAKVVARKDENGKVVEKRLAWTILLPGTAKPLRRFTQGGPRETDGMIRRRAREKAEQMLEEHARDTGSIWQPTSHLADFCEAEVRPAIAGDPELSELTKRRYLASLDLLLGICSGRRHQGEAHTQSLGPKMIKTGTRFVTMEKCLQEISRLHGKETARNARSVLTGRVWRALRRHELVGDSPLKGEKINLTSMAKEHEGARDGETVYLTRDEYQRVVQHLLDLDPAKGIVAPKRGRWPIEHRIAMRRGVIDLTLVQAGSGLRISEARQAWRGLVRDVPEGMNIDVDASIAKAGRPRLAYVLDDRVIEHLRKMLASRPEDPDDMLLVGQPADRTKVWDLSKVRAEARVLYDQVAEELEIPKLSIPGHLTHIWRATMNMQLMALGVPAAARAQQLGHTEQVALDYYTASMPLPMLTVARQGISG